MAGALLIESTHARYLDTERVCEGCNRVETEDDEQEDDETSFATCETTEQHGVDAFAEEFIYKMKGVWKHENQKSEEDCVERRVDAIAEDFINKMRGSWKLEKQRSVEEYIQRWARLHEF